jgi:hypothetical protein
MSQSRYEILMEALLNGDVPNIRPQSRHEAYLLALCQKGVGGGSGEISEEQIATAIENYMITNGMSDKTVPIADSATGKQYTLTIVNGKLTMTEVTE